MTTQQVQTASAKTEEVRSIAYSTPAVDIYENEHEILLNADLPGVSLDALSIRLDDDQLSIEALPKDSDHGSPLSLEFRPTAFRRVFQIQQRLDADKIEASLTHGVLSVRLPKASEMKTRSIPVKTS